MDSLSFAFKVIVSRQDETRVVLCSFDSEFCSILLFCLVSFFYHICCCCLALVPWNWHHVPLLPSNAWQETIELIGIETTRKIFLLFILSSRHTFAHCCSFGRVPNGSSSSRRRRGRRTRDRGGPSDMSSSDGIHTLAAQVPVSCVSKKKKLSCSLQSQASFCLWVRGPFVHWRCLAKVGVTQWCGELATFDN